MQFIPTQNEISSLNTMENSERLQYFLTRTIEAEEVWALSDNEGWILQEDNDCIVLQLWPYQQLAREYANQDTSCYPAATSLDHFVHSLIAHLIQQNIELDILPLKNKPGVRISASKLNELYESLLEAGDYYLEG
jgi:hypothetical protein